MSDITKFAEYMFITNKTNRHIYLDLEGIENNKDLFMFLIDLFCKGLLLCYGQPTEEEMPTIDFDNLTMENFAYIQQKMGNAGIIVNLSTEPSQVELITSINSDELELEDENKPLESYVFKIYRGFNIYRIGFSFARV